MIVVVVVITAATRSRRLLKLGPAGAVRVAVEVRLLERHQNPDIVIDRLGPSARPHACHEIWALARMGGEENDSYMVMKRMRG